MYSTMLDETVDYIKVEEKPDERGFKKDDFNNSGNNSPSRLNDEGVGMDDEQFTQRPVYSSVEAGMQHLYLACDQINNENGHEESELDSVHDETLVRLITSSEADAEASTASRSDRRKLPDIPLKTLSDSKNPPPQRSPKTLYSKAGSSKDTDDSDSQQRGRTSSFTALSSLWRRSTNSAQKGSQNEISGVFTQTHVAIYDFIARHSDELVLTAGDSVFVEIRHEDFWYEGVNLSTGQSGIFPSRYVADIMMEKSKELNPFNSVDSTYIPAEAAPEMPKSAVDQNQFFLRFLGSIEVSDYKGNEIICRAIKKLVNRHRSAGQSSSPSPCTLEISHRGITMIDHTQQFQRKSTLTKSKIGRLFSGEKNTTQFNVESEHFFPLKNVTFCGCHPKNTRFFAFIAKHPDEQRFLCNVFTSDYSTEPVAIAVGESFKKFYEEYLDYRAPTEDIYLE